MLNPRDLLKPFCLVILLRGGCWSLIASTVVVGATRNDAAGRTLLDYFHACGIADDAFARFADDRQIAEDELAVIRSIAVRLRDCPVDRLRRMIPSGGSGLGAGTLPTPAEAKGQRGRMLGLEGSVISVEIVPSPDADPLWRCQVRISEYPHRAVVYVAEFPEKAQAGITGRRVGLDGVFVKYVPGATAEPMAVIIAPRLRWLDDSPLGKLGMDFGLFDGIRDNFPITAADRDAFYCLLLLTRHVDPDYLKSDAEPSDGSRRALPDLFRDRPHSAAA